MLTKRPKRQYSSEIVNLESMIPENHFLRVIEKYFDWNFIYEEVGKQYSKFGRPSIDPVTLIKIPIIQYMFGIKSMRQTIKEIEVNMAYRWFLGLGFHDPVPHFSTFGKNYKRRLEGTSQSGARQ